MAKKPFDLVVIETKNKFVEAVNNSELPLTVIQYILTEIQNAVTTELNKSLPQLQEQYERELAQEKEVKKVEAEVVKQ